MDYQLAYRHCHKLSQHKELSSTDQACVDKLCKHLSLTVPPRENPLGVLCVHFASMFPDIDLSEGYSGALDFRERTERPYNIQDFIAQDVLFVVKVGPGMCDDDRHERKHCFTM